MYGTFKKDEDEEHLEDFPVVRISLQITAACLFCFAFFTLNSISTNVRAICGNRTGCI